jgi:hypothetical protein
VSDKVQRMIRLTRDQDDVLRKLAFEQRLSVAEIVRRIIEKHLNVVQTQHESGRKEQGTT